MVMFNADGSEGAMCGNGIRCLGKYVYDRGLTRATRLDIETASGMRRLELEVEGGRVSRVTVDMGSPRVERPLTLRWNGLALEGVPVWVGNPHFVVETEDPWNVDLARLGPMVEGHPAFPGGVNGEFVQVTAPDRLEMRVWERGSGETLACGTGACAAAAAVMTAGKLDRQSTVSLAGGELEIRWGKDGHVYMTGPAVTVFDGKLAD